VKEAIRMTKRSSIVGSREFERGQGKERRFSEAYKKFLKKYSLKEIGIEEDFFRSVRTKSNGNQRDDVLKRRARTSSQGML
jgi:hypothetical protein